MNVEWTLNEDAEVIAGVCVNGIHEALQARGLGANFLGKIMGAAPFPANTKTELKISFDNPNTRVVSHELETLAYFSIYCFLNAAFADAF